MRRGRWTGAEQCYTGGRRRQPHGGQAEWAMLLHAAGSFGGKQEAWGCGGSDKDSLLRWGPGPHLEGLAHHILKTVEQGDQICVSDNHCSEQLFLFPLQPSLALQLVIISLFCLEETPPPTTASSYGSFQSPSGPMIQAWPISVNCPSAPKGIGPPTLRIPKSTDVQVPYLKRRSVCI